MPFVKLDCGILDSTLWPERECREVFITALLMAEPHELKEDSPQLKVRSLDPTGWTVPKGWYGFVKAAGVGIVRRAHIEKETGLAALEQLGEPESDSRTADFEGRRLVRISGGYIVLNFVKYRDKDHTAAERSRRYRERKALTEGVTRDVTEETRDGAYPSASASASASGTGREPTMEQALAAARDCSATPEIAAQWWNDRDAVGWLNSKSQPIKNWRSDLASYASRCRTTSFGGRSNSGSTAWKHAVNGYYESGTNKFLGTDLPRGYTLVDKPSPNGTHL